MKTVKELIKELQKYPGDLTIGLNVFNHNIISGNGDSEINIEVGWMHFADPALDKQVLFIGGLPKNSGYKFQKEHKTTRSGGNVFSGKP